MAASSWALLHSGMFRVHDYTHAARIGELLRALQDGHFPVRWSANFGFGYGMPLFEFYAPLPFYVGALLYWLGVNITTSIKLLYLFCSLVTFWGTFQLGKRLFGRSGAILSAVALTLAPYRALNLFVRGDLSEAWGIMALPWVLLGIVQVTKREKRGWWSLLFGLIVLFLSHNITTLLFIPVSVLFAIGYWLIEKRKIVSGLQMIGIYILAIGFAAFYIFPALLEKDLTKVNGIFQGYFFYGNHFLLVRQFFEDKWGYGGSAPWPYNGISFFFGYGQFLGLGIALIFLVRAAVLKMFKRPFFKKTFRTESFLLFGLFSALFLLTIFMTTFKSHCIWDHLSFMVVIQFPWRWLSVAIVMLSLLIGSGTLFIRSRFWRFFFAVICSGVILIGNARYFQPENFIDVTSSFYYTDARRIRHDMSRTLNDYIPQQMTLDRLSKELPPIDVPYIVEPVFLNHTLLVSEKDAKILVDHVQEKLVQTNFVQPANVQFAVADFPGWHVYLDGKIIPTTLTPLGNIFVKVPVGEHTVGVQFGDSPIRFWSDVVSAASAIILLFLFVKLEVVKK